MEKALDYESGYLGSNYRSVTNLTDFEHLLSKQLNQIRWSLKSFLTCTILKFCYCFESSDAKLAAASAILEPCHYQRQPKIHSCHQQCRCSANSNCVTSTVMLMPQLFIFLIFFLFLYSQAYLKKKAFLSLLTFKSQSEVDGTQSLGHSQVLDWEILWGGMSLTGQFQWSCAPGKGRGEHMGFILLFPGKCSDNLESSITFSFFFFLLPFQKISSCCANGPQQPKVTTVRRLSREACLMLL